MEEATEDYNVIFDILSPEEIEQIPDEICKKLKNACTKRFNEFITAKALFETHRNNYDQKHSVLEEKFEKLNADYEECKQKLNLVENFSTDLQNRYEEAKHEITQLQNSVLRLEKDNVELRRQRDLFSDERDTLQSQVDRRNAELERSRLEIEALSNQLQSAIAAKCTALQSMQEVNSREMTLDFKEKRLEQEKDLMNQQNSNLREQIAKLSNELQAIRSESASRNLMKETRLAQVEEELRINQETIERYKEVQSTLQERCDELAQKVDEQRNQEITMHSSYREEVAAQTKLADLYKDLAEEANKKEEELTNAIKELQNLVHKATEEYGVLETKYVNETENLQREIEEKNSTIQKLEHELSSANELMQNLKQEKVDQAIEQLAPTAAITNRILKKGLSLTQIYTQLVDCTNEMELLKSENESLRSQMSKIMYEMEENAPLVQQKLHEYATARDTIKTLTTQLDELVVENNRLQENADEAKRKADFHAKQTAKLKTDMSDLARQVCFLLREIQELRTGCMVPQNDTSMTIDDDELSSSKVISRHLVTFRDIEELQEKNQQLLAVVRSLSAKKEEVERNAEESNTGALKEKIQGYAEKIAQMEQDQERLSKMMEQIIKQRDMYKTIVEKRSDNRMEQDELDVSGHNKSLDEKSTQRVKELEKKLAEADDRLKQLREEFESNKKEKEAHTRMLTEDMDKLRKEAENSNNKCCKLKSQLDTSKERFHLLQANVASYKSQIKTLEEKCNNYNTTISKHENSLSILHSDLMNSKSQASRAEVQLENLKQDYHLLKASEHRLAQEIEVLQRERQTQALLKADVESIKASLERAQSETILRTEQRFDDANRECAALRRRLQEEQDRFREITDKLEKQTIAAQERLLEEKKIADQARAELEMMRGTEAHHSRRIDELTAKLKEAQTNLITRPVTSEENTAKRIKELENELESQQAEMRTLSNQLKSTQHQSQQYCDIAEGAEALMRDLTSQYNKAKEEHETAIQNAQAQIVTLQKKVKDLEEEVAKAYSGHQESGSELRERLYQAERKLEEMDELRSQNEVLKSDLKAAVDASAEAEDKYAKEMMLHSTDIQILSKLKEENRSISSQIELLTQERDSAVSSMEIEKSMIDSRESQYRKEIEETKQRLEDLNKQNSLLHDQIQDLSDKLAVAHSHQGRSSAHESPENSMEVMNRSFTDADSNSVEQLMQVLKLLRREKDLAVTKFDILKAENLRLKTQIEITERRLKETESQLNSKRQELEIDVVAMSKHKELMRKVETLNAITDSNRTLREERDNLAQKVKELTEKARTLSAEMGPLQEKATGLESKVELLTQENTSLKAEATRWRQRANTLIERANKASPEDWRRLQTERENLSKLLTTERESHVKQTEELNNIKAEKIRLEENLALLQKQLQTQADQISSLTEESKRVNNELTEALNDASAKAKELAEYKKKLDDNEAVLTDARSKELQIKKIAKKYKMQYEELVKTYEEEKAKFEELKATITSGEGNITQEKENELKEAGRSEMRSANLDLTNKLAESNRSVAVMQSENENLKKEIDVVNKNSLEKEEKSKQLLRGARQKIASLNEVKNNYEKEIAELKAKVDTSDGESSTLAETEARLVALKSQMEGRIARLEHEKAEIAAEKEALAQRVSLLQRQLQGVSGVSATTEPPTANIKPMSARTETPLASIRPMSVVVQSRTAAVLPTTAPVPVHVAPQQQQQQTVHTTETSSPTSSHTDYQPASTSSSSQTVGGNLRQMMVQPQLSESAESTQREEMESNETVQQQSCQPQQCLQTQQTQQQPSQQQTQQSQQTVALVSPRVEQQQQSTTSDQQQTVASSSTQSVSTSQASTGQKRARGSEDVAEMRQDPISSPKTKRIRQQEMSGSASEVEYQVPTSSQRDQDEEGEDGCVVVVDCDEGAGANQHAQEEEFDNDPYEEMEEEEELGYVEVEIEGDNNEVELVELVDDSAMGEVPRQGSNQQQQSEISSAGTSGEPPSSFTRSSRGIAPMPRQQTLMLPQGYEDGGDDCIVPSTPTLFVPRRDGFGEAVSSPQVPQGRFTFGEPTTPATASSTPSMMTPTGTATRTMFVSSTPGSQGVPEGMDDTRMDLTQLEDGGTGRSVPTTPLQVSPAAELPSLTSTAGQGDNFHADTFQNIAMQSIGTESSGNVDDRAGESSVPSVSAAVEAPETANEELSSETPTNTEGVSTESENKPEEQGASGSGANDEDNVDTGGETAEDQESEVTEDENKEENREAEASPSSNTRQRTLAMAVSSAPAPSPIDVRGVTTRNAARSPLRGARGARPTPIVWGESQPSSRGTMSVRGTRGNPNEGPRGRGTRGRRMRSKYYGF